MTLTKRIALFAASAIVTGLVAMGVDARASENQQVIQITASKYHFSPDHIILKRGEPVKLDFTSTDATHGFMIRALKIDAEIKPGKVTEMTVTPQTPGTFKAICDHYCGLGHGMMKMTVSVE